MTAEMKYSALALSVKSAASFRELSSELINGVLEHASIHDIIYILSIPELVPFVAPLISILTVDGTGSTIAPLLRTASIGDICDFNSHMVYIFELRKMDEIEKLKILQDHKIGTQIRKHVYVVEEYNPADYNVVRNRILYQLLTRVNGSEDDNDSEGATESDEYNESDEEFGPMLRSALFHGRPLQAQLPSLKAMNINFSVSQRAKLHLCQGFEGPILKPSAQPGLLDIIIDNNVGLLADSIKCCGLRSLSYEQVLGETLYAADHLSRLTVENLKIKSPFKSSYGVTLREDVNNYGLRTVLSTPMAIIEGCVPYKLSNQRYESLRSAEVGYFESLSDVAFIADNRKHSESCKLTCRFVDGLDDKAPTVERCEFCNWDELEVEYAGKFPRFRDIKASKVKTLVLNRTVLQRDEESQMIAPSYEDMMWIRDLRPRKLVVRDYRILLFLPMVIDTVEELEIGFQVIHQLSVPKFIWPKLKKLTMYFHTNEVPQVPVIEAPNLSTLVCRFVGMGPQTLDDVPKSYPKLKHLTVITANTKQAQWLLQFPREALRDLKSLVIGGASQTMSFLEDGVQLCSLESLKILINVPSRVAYYGELDINAIAPNLKTCKVIVNGIVQNAFPPSRLERSLRKGLKATVISIFASSILLLLVTPDIFMQR
jgi:hypothetical protein